MEDPTIKYLNFMLGIKKMSDDAIIVLTNTSNQLEGAAEAMPLKTVLDMSRQVIETQSEVIRRMAEQNMRIGDQIAELAAKARAQEEAL